MQEGDSVFERFLRVGRARSGEDDGAELFVAAVVVMLFGFLRGKLGRRELEDEESETTENQDCANSHQAPRR
jgi:hypothetical protein